MNEDSINKFIGEKIRILRKDMKLSQSQLADELSIHYKHLGCIENSKKAISIALLAKMCKFFNKNPIYFFDFTKQNLNTEDDTQLLNLANNMLKSMDKKNKKPRNLYDSNGL